MRRGGEDRLLLSKLAIFLLCLYNILATLCEGYIHTIVVFGNHLAG